MERSSDGMQPEELKSVIMAGGASSSTCMWADARREPLLPGIPDDVTLDHITARLPWRTFYILATVSPAWLHAVRSHQVYNARVRANSTETLALVKCGPPDSDCTIALFSTREKSCYELPPMEAHDKGHGKNSDCVTIDGKVYVLEDHLFYVMDLAGQHGWKPCARLPERNMFPVACGVIHGKIYAFGSTCDWYDPAKNTWSPVRYTPYRPSVSYRNVTKVGEEFFIHGFNNVPIRGRNYSNSLEAYHPIKDESRVVECSEMEAREARLFSTQGKLYSIGNFGICVYDIGKNSWTHVHSNEFSAIPMLNHRWLAWHAAQGVDDELLAAVTLDWISGIRRICDIQSNGFGGRNEEISWKEAQCFSPFADWPHDTTRSVLKLIQL